MRVRTVPVTASPGLSAAQRRSSAARACSSRTTRRSTTTSSSVTSSLVMRQLICCAHECFELGGIARAAATGGHEGAHADVDVRPPLMTAVTVPTTASFLRECLFEGGPVAGLRDAEARERVVALFIAAGDRNGNLVARLYALGVVRETQSAAERLPSCSRCRRKPARRRARRPCPQSA